MLLKLGIAMMSVALLMAGAVAIFAFSQRDEPVAVAHTAARESAPRYVERRGIEPREPTAEVKSGTVAPKSGPEQHVEPGRRVTPDPDPEPAAKPTAKPAVKPVTSRSPAPEAGATPGISSGRIPDWPTPTREQVRRAGGPRHYQLTAGAVMGLTIRAIGLYNVPVFDSRAQWALNNGVAHVPETSMPWSKGAQRNVYLEGHRLGYPGTGSHLLFYNLDKLGRGDEILLRDRSGRRYGYRVIDTFVVTPRGTWVMGQVRGRDLVTLQTCTGPSWSKRLIVRAERI